MTTNKVASWTGIPPNLVGNNLFKIDGFLSGIILAGILGLAFGATPTVMANKLVGGRGITGQPIPLLAHTEVWPKKRPLETSSERLERLDLKIFEEHPPTITAQTTPKMEEHITDQEVQTTTKLVEGKEKTSKPLKSKLISGKVVSPPSAINKPSEMTVKEAIPLPSTKERLLVRLRKDSSRLYIGKEYAFGDLTWGFRNATDEGIEFVVTNNENSTRTYYLPKASVEGVDALAEGSIVSPGQTLFGAIPISGLKKKKEVIITLQAIGFGDRKVKVNLPW